MTSLMAAGSQADVTTSQPRDGIPPTRHVIHRLNGTRHSVSTPHSPANGTLDSVNGDVGNGLDELPTSNHEVASTSSDETGLDANLLTTETSDNLQPHRTEHPEDNAVSMETAVVSRNGHHNSHGKTAESMIYHIMHFNLVFPTNRHALG